MAIKYFIISLLLNISINFVFAQTIATTKSQNHDAAIKHLCDSSKLLDLGDIFSQFFGGGMRRTPKGQNINIDVTISFKDSVFGVSKTVSYYKKRDSQKHEVTVDIPAGIAEIVYVTFDKVLVFTNVLFR